MKKSFFCLFFLLILFHYGFSQNRDTSKSKTLYVAATTYNLNSSKDYATTFEINYFNSIYSKGMTDEDAISKMTDFRTIVNQQTNASKQHSLYEYGQNFLELGIGLGTAYTTKKVTVPIALSIIKSGSSISKAFYDDYFSNTSVQNALNMSYGIENFDNLFQQQILESSYDNAQTDPQYQHLYNLLFQGKLGHSTTETSDQILNNDPVLSQSVLLKDVLKNVHDIQLETISDEDREKAFQTVFVTILDSVKTVASDNNDMLKTILGNQNTLQNNEQLQALASHERELSEIRLEAASSAVGYCRKQQNYFSPIVHYQMRLALSAMLQSALHPQLESLMTSHQSFQMKQGIFSVVLFCREIFLVQQQVFYHCSRRQNIHLTR